MTDYKPVECGLHDEYELTIMQRRRLLLEWQDETGQARSATVLPVDLVTQAGEEFLLVQDSDRQQLRIRLDRILSHSVTD